MELVSPEMPPAVQQNTCRTKFYQDAGLEADVRSKNDKSFGRSVRCHKRSEVVKAVPFAARNWNTHREEQFPATGWLFCLPYRKEVCSYPNAGMCSSQTNLIEDTSIYAEQLRKDG